MSLNYIFFDLEWNTVHISDQNTLNEIIEIGAVKVDEEFNILDDFSCLISPTVSKKMDPHCAETNHLDMSELYKNGLKYYKAMSNFKNWCGKAYQNIFVSWSTSDLYTLAQNKKFFSDNSNINFIKKYIDAQSYCEKFVDSYDGSHSIGLQNMAKLLNIDSDEEKLHRALNDSYIAKKCVQTVFDYIEFTNSQILCTGDFFARLIYKPYNLKKPVGDSYNLYNEDFLCPVCSSLLNRLGDFKYYRDSLHAIYYCRSCKCRYIAHINVKKTFDGVKIHKHISPCRDLNSEQSISK